MNRFQLYPTDILPDGFKYPQQIIGMSNSGNYQDIYPWWFIDASSRAGELFYKNRCHDGRNLVPFAKVDDDRNDTACFDGDDQSGNPAILMLVLDGSGRAYSFRDFDEWMNSALRDAAR